MAEKIKISWEQVDKCVKSIAEKLKDEKFDAVISIGRGGMIPARLLAEELDIHTAYIIDAKAYTKDDKFGEMHIEDLNISKDVHNVLVVDDVLFTGKTLDAVMTLLAKHENITGITNAFLYRNYMSTYAGTTHIYSLAYDGDAQWLVFPWEKN